MGSTTRALALSQFHLTLSAWSESNPYPILPSSTSPTDPQSQPQTQHFPLFHQKSSQPNSRNISPPLAPSSSLRSEPKSPKSPSNREHDPFQYQRSLPLPPPSSTCTLPKSSSPQFPIFTSPQPQPPHRRITNPFPEVGSTTSPLSSASSNEGYISTLASISSSPNTSSHSFANNHYLFSSYSNNPFTLTSNTRPSGIPSTPQGYKYDSYGHTDSGASQVLDKCPNRTGGISIHSCEPNTSVDSMTVRTLRRQPSCAALGPKRVKPGDKSSDSTPLQHRENLYFTNGPVSVPMVRNFSRPVQGAPMRQLEPTKKLELQVPVLQDPQLPELLPSPSFSHLDYSTAGTTSTSTNQSSLSTSQSISTFRRSKTRAVFPTSAVSAPMKRQVTRRGVPTVEESKRIVEVDRLARAQANLDNGYEERNSQRKSLRRSQSLAFAKANTPPSFPLSNTPQSLKVSLGSSDEETSDSSSGYKFPSQPGQTWSPASVETSLYPASTLSPTSPGYTFIEDSSAPKKCLDLDGGMSSESLPESLRAEAVDLTEVGRCFIDGPDVPRIVGQLVQPSVRRRSKSVSNDAKFNLAPFSPPSNSFNQRSIAIAPVHHPTKAELIAANSFYLPPIQPPSSFRSLRASPPSPHPKAPVQHQFDNVTKLQSEGVSSRPSQPKLERARSELKKRGAGTSSSLLCSSPNVIDPLPNIEGAQEPNRRAGDEEKKTLDRSVFLSASSSVKALFRRGGFDESSGENVTSPITASSTNREMSTSISNTKITQHPDSEEGNGDREWREDLLARAVSLSMGTNKMRKPIPAEMVYPGVKEKEEGKIGRGKSIRRGDKVNIETLLGSNKEFDQEPEQDDLQESRHSNQAKSLPHSIRDGSSNPTFKPTPLKVIGDTTLTSMSTSTPMLEPTPIPEPTPRTVRSDLVPVSQWSPSPAKDKTKKEKLKGAMSFRAGRGLKSLSGDKEWEGVGPVTGGIENIAANTFTVGMNPKPPAVGGVIRSLSRSASKFGLKSSGSAKTLISRSKSFSSLTPNLSRGGTSLRQLIISSPTPIVVPTIPQIPNISTVSLRNVRDGLRSGAGGVVSERGIVSGQSAIGGSTHVSLLETLASRTDTVVGAGAKASIQEEMSEDFKGRVDAWRNGVKYEDCGQDESESSSEMRGGQSGEGLEEGSRATTEEERAEVRRQAEKDRLAAAMVRHVENERRRLGEIAVAARALAVALGEVGAGVGGDVSARYEREEECVVEKKTKHESGVEET